MVYFPQFARARNHESGGRLEAAGFRTNLLCMKRMKAILVLTAAIAFGLAPFLSPGFNGFEAGQFPVPQENPPVQPAGYAFGIWGVIYLWLLAGALYGLLMRADDGSWDVARWPLFVSLTVGAAWLPVAQISVPWATVLIWVMLLSALAALFLAGREKRLWQQGPVGLYAGWLTAASSVSIGLVLAGYGVMSAQAAAIVGLLLALVLAAAVLGIRRDAPAYAFGVIWALAGVAVANAQPVNALILGLSVTGAVLIGLQAWRTRRP